MTKKSSNDANNYLDINRAKTISMLEESWFRIMCLKKEMKNNVDKWSVKLKP